MSEHEKHCCGGHHHEEGHCGCHRHEENLPVDEEMDILTLTLEDDTEVPCEVVGIFDVDGKEYIALYPLEDMGDGEEGVLLYAFEEGEDDEVNLEAIPEEDFDRVAEVFESLVEEEDAQ